MNRKTIFALVAAAVLVAATAFIIHSPSLLAASAGSFGYGPGNKADNVTGGIVKNCHEHRDECMLVVW